MPRLGMNASDIPAAAISDRKLKEASEAIARLVRSWVSPTALSRR
ncbi:hypothetical protein ABZS29_12015 [Kribbella sp. NPDC005582]